MAGGSAHLKCVSTGGVEQDRLADFFGGRQCVSNSQKYRFGQVERVLFWEIKSQCAERTLGCREWDFFFTRAGCYFVLTVHDTDLSSDFHVVCF